MDFNPELCSQYALDDGPLIVEKLDILGGANYFSAGPVVRIRLNLGPYSEVYTNAIPGFYDRLKELMPSLHEHHCSEKKPGGFFLRVMEGTLLGHVTEHVAIELQTLAGMDVAYGKTRSTLQEGVFNIVFRFFDEAAGIYTAKAAVNLINSILTGKPFPVDEIIRNLEQIREHRLLGPSTQAIVNEAEKRGIPFFRLDEYNLIQLGTGCYQKRIRATITSDTNMLAVETADNKHLTYRILNDAGIPVPESIRTDEKEKALSFFRLLKKPVTVKPSRGNLGRKIHLNLHTEEEFLTAFDDVLEAEGETIVQTYVPGSIFRLLVIDYKFVAAVKLTPPFVIGNGRDSIRSLVDALNAAPERKFGDKSPLSKIELRENTLALLKNAGLNPDSILENDRILPLEVSGNPRLGGISEDVTESVHPVNIFLAERACKAIGLNAGGVDIVAPSVSEPVTTNGGVIIEVNAAPDFRMHLMPAKGKARNVAEQMVNMLFPEGQKCSVPLFSVTGTVGKTTTSFLLDFCLRREGFYTGLATTEGIFIHGNLLKTGDMTGPEQVALVLKDPTINCAVVETSREGILRYGLGYKYADCGIFLNMHDEHVGFDDIKYIEDLAYAKSVVAEEVYTNGHSVLNAGSKLTLEVMDRLYSNPVLFSVNPILPEMRKHIDKGNIGVTLNGPLIEIYNQRNRIPLTTLDRIPLTFGNKARLMYENILAAVAALYSFGIPPEKIAESLHLFSPGFHTLPGRLNPFAVKDFEIILDYAHNEVAMKGLIEYLGQKDGMKFVAMDATGDRSDEEIRILGKTAAAFFDEILIFEGDDLRGREPGSITQLLREGAESAATGKNIREFPGMEEALSALFALAKPGACLVALSRRPHQAHDIVQSFINRSA